MQINPKSALVGNYIGAIKPTTSRMTDLNGDRLVDMEISYSVRSTMDLRFLSKKRDPLGLHYQTTDGTNYLVTDIFDLGRPMPIIVNEGDSGENNQITDGSGGGDDQNGGDDLATPTSFQITEGGRVAIDIFTVTGRKIRTLVNQDLSAGRYDMSWDGRDDAGVRMASGIYFYRITGPGMHDVRKIHIAR